MVYVLFLFYPVLILAAAWMMLYGEQLSKGQFTVQSLLVLATMIAFILALGMFAVSLYGG